ncbi:hypothetical protein ATY41_01320 [Leifsonia xyli subsp. xyli]|uniref:Multidrug ABC transporter ATPase n=2 Tax=Leifsonia xyli subsp. xyli TaxID=59736 RepID=Q6ADL0_LEIXX|nr:hypothetical protein [Leifsonia xyli]AAT89536.1 hypothetical protein Lxx17930 [Leifsonia xyli subsp. xyli str. CTCB07]ODA91350.1 hypothetical protein ATY41_01320 [Leifsonia xyli subsp. xyli]
MTQQTPPPFSRLQRILSYIAAALVAVSLLCIAAILIGSALGRMPQQGSGEGLWPAVFLFPLAAFPLAFVLIIAIIVAGALQRRRAAAKMAGPKNRR